MYRKRKYQQKRRKRGRGLLGADWAKKYKILRPYLEKRKQRGGSWGHIVNWGVKKLANPNNPLTKFVTNPNAGVKFLNKIVNWI